MGAEDLRLLTPREVAEILRVKPQQLLELCRAGELSYIDVGGGRKKIRRMFERQDVEKFITRRRRTEQWAALKRAHKRRPRIPLGISEPVSFVELAKRLKDKEKPKGK